MILGVFAYSIIGLTFFFIIEFIKVYFLLRAENSRKLIHVGSCLIVCTMPFFIDKADSELAPPPDVPAFVLNPPAPPAPPALDAEPPPPPAITK